MGTLTTKIVYNLLLGGLSILVLAASWIFVDKNASLFEISQIAFGAAFIGNHPHFTSSYMLMYGDFRKNILKSARYIWAAIVVPAILLIYLLYCLAAERRDLLGHAVNAMFFLVGWHYVKQIFGVVAVTAAQRNYFYSGFDRVIVLTNLFSIWAVSFLNSQTYAGWFDFYGLKYQSFELSVNWMKLSYLVFFVSLAVVVYRHVEKYLKTGKTPGTAAAVALLTLYAWYLPVFAHPFFAYLIPFFHSLQYLVFVWYFKRQQQTDRHPSAWYKYLFLYAFGAIVSGALIFEIIPKALDSAYKFQNADLGEKPFLVVFLLFINIHHYFIDNTIWKSSNLEVKKYLTFSA